MRPIQLVERSEPIAERNIAFREYLGPQGSASQGGAGVLLGYLGRSTGKVRCQPIQRDAPKAKAPSHQLVEGVTTYHDIASGTGTGIPRGSRPDQAVECFLFYQCDITLPGVGIATATRIKAITDNTTSGHHMGRRQRQHGRAGSSGNVEGDHTTVHMFTSSALVQ
jgi:hypothetical protein